MKMECGKYKSEMNYINDIFNDYKIIGEFNGGSAAKLFVLEGQSKKYVVKICMRDGIENGREKLIGEIEFINSDIGKSYGKFPEIILSYYDENIAWYLMPYYSEYITLMEVLDTKNTNMGDVFQNILNDIFESMYIKEKKRMTIDYLFVRNINRVMHRMRLAENMLFEFNNIKSEIEINGRVVRNYKYILNMISENTKMNKILTPIYSSLTHDDFTIENIMIHKNDWLKYIVIDPRGIKDTGPYREYMYDLSKLTCTLGGFTAIKYREFNINKHGDQYSLEIHEKRNYDLYYNQVLFLIAKMKNDFFKEDEYGMERLLFTEACHYLADIPCRLYNGDSADIAMALYLKGTEMLNKVYYEMLMGV